MNEAEWDECTVPQPILEFLRASGKASDRKLRLFACTCCRRVWSHLRDDRSQKALEVSEKYADGQVSDQELLESHDGADTAAELVESAFRRGEVNSIAVNATIAVSRGTAIGDSASRVNPDDWWINLRRDDAVPAACAAARFAALASTDRDKLFSESSYKDECAAQVVLIHCIFGNPFQPAVTIAPAVLAWNDRTIVRLAQSVYEERSLPDGTLDLARLAILADALEEAGVTDALLIEHLRGPGPHVRGCFAIDTILGLA